MLTCLHKCLTSGSSPTALDMAADVILTLQVTSLPALACKLGAPACDLAVCCM